MTQKVDGDMSIILVRYNGEWQLLNGRDDYVSGEKMLLTFQSNIRFHKVLDLLSRKLDIDLNKYEVNLYMLSDRVIVGQRVPINDDESMKAFCMFANRNFKEVMSLYVTTNVKCSSQKDESNMCSTEVVFDLNTSPHSDMAYHFSDNVNTLTVDLHKDEVENIRRHDNTEHNLTGFVTIGNHNFNSGNAVASTSHRIVEKEHVKLESSIMKFNFDIPGVEIDGRIESHENKNIIGSGGVKAMEIFKDKVTLQNMIGMIALKEGFQFHVTRSNKSAWEVRCIYKSCTWRARAIRLDGCSLFQVRYIGNSHTCPRDQINPHHRQAGKKTLGEMMKSSFLRSERVYTPKDIQEDVAKNFKIDISYSQAWRAKQWAVSSIRGSMEDSFRLLPHFCHQLCVTNPGSVAEVTCDVGDRFKSVYMSIGCSIKAFKQYLRPVICIDAAHLKGKYMGVILVAVGIDGNNQIYPLAFGIAAAETNITWYEFLSKFKESISDIPHLAIISDRAPSIIEAVKSVFPNYVHGICCHHLKMNMKVKFKDISAIDVLFWQAAKACNIPEFNEHMENIRRLSEPIYKYLEEAGFQNWAHCMFPGRRYGVMTTNCAESMNAVTRHARYLPVTMLLEYLRATMQKWFYERRKEAEIHPYVLSRWATEEMSNIVSNITSMDIFPITSHIFEVRMWDRNDLVNLQTRTCSCGKFQLFELPCEHVAGVAKFLKLTDCNSFVSTFYSRDAWRAIYDEGVFPLGDQSKWTEIPKEKSVLLPQLERKRPGRPRKVKRLLSSGEDIKRVVCSRCNETGHNRSKCKAYLPITMK